MLKVIVSIPYFCTLSTLYTGFWRSTVNIDKIKILDSKPYRNFIPQSIFKVLLISVLDFLVILSYIFHDAVPYLDRRDKMTQQSSR